MWRALCADGDGTATDITVIETAVALTISFRDSWDNLMYTIKTKKGGKKGVCFTGSIQNTIGWKGDACVQQTSTPFGAFILIKNDADPDAIWAIHDSVG